MFKTLTSLEFGMCREMKTINKLYYLQPYLNSLTDDQSYALHECNARGFIERIDEYTDANGHYHFSSVGNTHLNMDGLAFLKEKSLSHRIISAVFDILKGTTGYIFGILSGIAVEVIVYFLTDSGAIVLFLDAVLGK